VNRSTPLLIAALLLTGCASSIKQSPDKSLALAACPPLAPLESRELGAVVLKLSEVAGQYHKCRAAALEGK
jgi:hypothetical protein